MRQGNLNNNSPMSTDPKINEDLIVCNLAQSLVEFKCRALHGFCLRLWGGQVSGDVRVLEKYILETNLEPNDVLKPDTKFFVLEIPTSNSPHDLHFFSRMHSTFNFISPVVILYFSAHQFTYGTASKKTEGLTKTILFL